MHGRDVRNEPTSAVGDGLPFDPESAGELEPGEAEIVAEGLRIQQPGLSLERERAIVAAALHDVGLDRAAIDR